MQDSKLKNIEFLQSELLSSVIPAVLKRESSELKMNEIKIRITPVILFVLLAVGSIFLITNYSHAAITISGSDTITASGSSIYTTSGCDGTVKWGVTNPGASISQSGVLTTSGACGTVLVAARCSADGVIATKGVRVTNGGQWVQTGYSHWGCSTPPLNVYTPCELAGSLNCSGLGLGYFGQPIVREIISGNSKTAYSILYVGRDETAGGGSISGCAANSSCGSLGSIPAEFGLPGKCQNQYGNPNIYFVGKIYDKTTYDWRCSQSSTCPYNITPSKEICGDLIDNNCNGEVDEGCVVCEDKDGDGYYAYNSTSCQEGNDCNDNDASIHPGASEICDNKDNDCNGESDEGLSTDADGDGHYTSDSCKEPRDDCNDDDATTYPGAEEICGDGIDNNCDGNRDEGCLVDADGDGYYAGPQGNDSDDNDATVYPGAPEICDGKDNNSDGKTDEGCCDVEASISPQWVAPQKTGAALGGDIADIIILLNKPIPINGCVIDLKVYSVPYSGGHDHHDALRPHGMLDGADKLTIYLSSGEIDPVVVKYKSSEIAGMEEIIAKVRETGEEIKNAIDVKVSVLGQLGGGDEWRLTGWTTAHQDNHYGEASTINAAMAIARDYFEATEATLGINDMSLEWGGLFDIGPPQGTFWLPPHRSHRKGTSIDIDKNALGSNGWIRVDRSNLSQICGQYNGRLLDEATFHCEITH